MLNIKEMDEIEKKNSTMHEPLEQFVVDQIVKRHTGRLPGLYQTVGVANIQDFQTNFATQLVRRLRS